MLTARSKPAKWDPSPRSFASRPRTTEHEWGIAGINHEDPWLSVPRSVDAAHATKLSCRLLVGPRDPGREGPVLIGLWSQDLFATLLAGVTLAWPSDGWAVTFLLHTISGEDPGTVATT